MAAVVLCVAVLAVPALFALNVLLLVLLALSFNLLFGMTGLLSFGHAAFYAAGAYATALLLRAGAPLLPGVLAGAPRFDSNSAKASRTAAVSSSSTQGLVRNLKIEPRLTASVTDCRSV